MSLWFRGKNRQGKRHYYSISIPWGLILMILIAIFVALLLPLLAWLQH
jgi:hypothetical protein